MNDIVAYGIGYVSLFIVSFFLLNFISNGFLGTFIRVRASRGKKVLVEVRGQTNIYYRSGFFIDDALRYKSQAKVKKIISNVPLSCVVRKLGVPSISVDEATGGILDADFDGVTGHDPSKVDSMITRALMLPQNKDNKWVILIVLVALVLVGLSVYGAFKLNDIIVLLEGLKTSGVIV